MAKDTLTVKHVFEMKTKLLVKSGYQPKVTEMFALIQMQIGDSDQALGQV